MRRRTGNPPVAAIGPATMAILLNGWGADWPAEAPDRWDVFDADHLENAWRDHRAELMAEAKRRYIAEPWGLQFDVQED
jgi:hypothetical protein